MEAMDREREIKFWTQCLKERARKRKRNYATGRDRITRIKRAGGANGLGLSEPSVEGNKQLLQERDFG